MPTVRLPAYFDRINIDLRYQLTVIGQFAQAIIAKKEAGNRFVIRTDKARVEVSWQVTARRNDAYMRAHPFHEIQNKTKADKELTALLHEEGVLGCCLDMLRECAARRAVHPPRSVDGGDVMPARQAQRFCGLDRLDTPFESLADRAHAKKPLQARAPPPPPTSRSNQLVRGQAHTRRA